MSLYFSKSEKPRLELNAFKLLRKISRCCSFNQNYVNVVKVCDASATSFQMNKGKLKTKYLEVNETSLIGKSLGDVHRVNNVNF